MVKKGDIFTAYKEGFPTVNLMATMDFEEGLLLYCINSSGQFIHVSKNEIGEKLGNIDELEQCI